MKNSKRVMLQLLFISIISFTGCQDLSPRAIPAVTEGPVPDSTPEITSAPGNTPEATPSNESTTVPTSTPAGTPGAETSAAPTATITEEPDPGGSPGPTPVLTPGPIPTDSSRKILISEIMYNPNSPDSEWEWIEVFNNTEEEMNLSGWVIDDGNGTPHGSSNIESGSIPPKETCILFNSDGVTLDEFKAAWGSELHLVAVTGWGAMGLNNSGDKISIWDSFSSYQGDHLLHLNALHTLEYSDKSPWPADNGSGSIYLKDLSADHTDGKNWALSTNGVSTPTGTCHQSTAGGTNTGADTGSP